MKNIDIRQLSQKQKKLIADLSRRRKRKEYGMCICEGMRSCCELYNTRPDLIHYAVVTNSLKVKALSIFPKVNFYILPDNKFGRLASTVNSQGILFVTQIPSYSEEPFSKSPFMLVLDGIGDPGNFGTIMRAVLAAGLDELWYSSNTVDPFSEKTVRSALGAQFRLGLRKFDDLSLLMNRAKEQGFYQVYRTDPAGGENFFNIKGLFEKSIIVFGNEASGVKELENSIPLHIPMRSGFESINVAQAVTIILFEAVRRKVLL